MQRELVKSHLNLYAVLPNLEELVAFDPEISQLVSTWNVGIEFIVFNGPHAHVTIRDGQCKVGPGPGQGTNVKLWFKSPAHPNAMFDGKAKPIPIKGFSRLGFMSKEFPKLTDRLEYYMRANGEVLEDQRIFEFVTRCMLYTAILGLAELAALDPDLADLAGHTPNGTAEFKVLPDGPAAHLTHTDGKFASAKGSVESPNVKMQFRDHQVCNDLLNGQVDAFAALGRNDVMIKGFLPLADQLNAMLKYLEPYLK